MELHSFDWVLFMPQSHDGPRTVFLRGPGADFEICRQVLLFHDQRVIARCGHWHGESLKHGSVVMHHGAGLSVHQMRSTDDASAKGLANRLMPQANTQQRRPAGEVPNQINTYAGFVRSAGAG